MEKIIKLLVVVVITAFSFLPIKSYGQIFNIKDTLEKYNKEVYLLEESGWKIGNADNPSGIRKTVVIYHKGNPAPERVIKFDKLKDSLGDFIIDDNWISYKIVSSRKINEKGDHLFTSIEKFYGARGSSYSPEKRSWVEKDWENRKNTLWASRNKPICIPLSEFDDLLNGLKSEEK